MPHVKYSALNCLKMGMTSSMSLADNRGTYRLTAVISLIATLDTAGQGAL